MNAQQTAYQIAKAVYETAIAEKHSRLAPYDYMLDNSDDDFEAYTIIEMGIHDELNIDAHAANLRKAEDAMIDWALAKVNKVAFVGEEKNAIAIASAARNQFKVRKQLIDMSFKLA